MVNIAKCPAAIATTRMMPAARVLAAIRRVGSSGGLAVQEMKSVRSAGKRRLDRGGLAVGADQVESAPAEGLLDRGGIDAGRHAPHAAEPGQGQRRELPPVTGGAGHLLHLVGDGGGKGFEHRDTGLGDERVEIDQAADPVRRGGGGDAGDQAAVAEPDQGGGLATLATDELTHLGHVAR